MSPSLEAATLFQDTRLVQKLFSWAETGISGLEALQFYAVGLLAIAIKLHNMAEHFKNENVKLAQLMLEKMLIQKDQESSTVTEPNITGKEFSLKRNHHNKMKTFNGFVIEMFRDMPGESSYRLNASHSNLALPDSECGFSC